MQIPQNALDAVRDRTSLFAFLHTRLGWPVALENTFLYAGPNPYGELATRAEIGEIVPFMAGVPFTIVLIEFKTPFHRAELRENLTNARGDPETRQTWRSG